MRKTPLSESFIYALIHLQQHDLFPHFCYICVLTQTYICMYINMYIYMYM